MESSSFKHSGTRITTPFVMTIFGATGDLTARKLMPALYDLFLDGVLPKTFFIVGFARRPFSRTDFQLHMRQALEKFSAKEVRQSDWNQFKQCLHYQQGTFEDRAGYDKLVELVSGFDTDLKMCVTRFFYLATPPVHYENILTFLKKTRLSEGCGHDTPQFTRVLIEKPFGKDLETAQALDARLVKIFRESQVYRIDHYLGKETVQNILAFRFANKIFEPIWNSKYIDHVQITMAERSGVGTRGGFYDGVGALSDVAQNHLLQLLALVTMEEPESFSANAIRSKRARAIESIQCIEPKDVGKYVVRGQYGGKIQNSESRIQNSIKSYREESNVDPKSITETFVALRLTIPNKRWEGVWFYLRTGKRMARTVTAISVHFKRSVHSMFGGKLDPGHRNVLTFYIQPREGISLTLETKRPGFGVELEPTTMDFAYSSAEQSRIDAYERILVDSMVGDQTLFPATRGIMASWQFISKIMQGWKRLGSKGLHMYAPEGWGPEQSDEIFTKEGNTWYIK